MIPTPSSQILSFLRFFFFFFFIILFFRLGFGVVCGLGLGQDLALSALDVGDDGGLLHELLPAVLAGELDAHVLGHDVFPELGLGGVLGGALVTVADRVRVFALAVDHAHVLGQIDWKRKED